MKRMNLKMILLNELVILLISFSAIVCAGKTGQIANVNNIYTEDKPNITVTSAQPEFVIKLKSNPTTGYSWFLREYDNTLIKPVKHSFQAPTESLMGAPGFELWTFRVKAVGFTVPQQTTIRMIYARPWQGSDSSTQLVFRVTTSGSVTQP